MMKLTIASVGSSRLIAEEIRDIIKSLLGSRLHVITCLTEEIVDDRLADLYVCARTQYPRLSEILPKQKLFLMELQPASTFFLSIARIPAGSEVYIFNNHLEYPIFLADYCRSLGMDKVQYIPLAFEDMMPAELADGLSKARYIIGVDRFTNLLKAVPYQKHLRPDVTIIAGKRTASLHSAFAVLQSIGSIMLQENEKACSCLAQMDADALKVVLQDIDAAIDMLQAATIRSVVSQAVITVPAVAEEPAIPTVQEMPLPVLQEHVHERLQLLKSLQHKLCRLHK